MAIVTAARRRGGRRCRCTRSSAGAGISTKSSARSRRRPRALYLNSPNNPAGGILTRADLERLAAIARERNLWVFSDEAYEDMVYDGEHVSIASLPGMYDRTIPLYTFSKTYAVTGVRVGYFAIKDPVMRARALKVVLYTTSNVSSLAQYGAIGALEGSQQCIDGLPAGADDPPRHVLRRDSRTPRPASFSGKPPDGAFYAFVKINPDVGEGSGHYRRIAVLGDGRAPDQGRAHRLRARRGLRRAAKAISGSALAAAVKS